MLRKINQNKHRTNGNNHKLNKPLKNSEKQLNKLIESRQHNFSNLNTHKLTIMHALIQNNEIMLFSVEGKTIEKYFLANFEHSELLQTIYREFKNEFIENIIAKIGKNKNIDTNVLSKIMKKYTGLYNAICEKNIISFAVRLTVKFPYDYFVEIQNQKIIDFSDKKQAYYNIKKYNTCNKIPNKVWWNSGFLQNKNNVECSVCFNEKRENVKTKCNHVFCKECVFTWVKKNGNSCPLCRTIFFEENEISFQYNWNDYHEDTRYSLDPNEFLALADPASRISARTLLQSREGRM